MTSKYNIGETVLVVGTITAVEQLPCGMVLYRIRECDLPVMEDAIAGKIEKPWELSKRYQGD